MTERDSYRPRSFAVAAWFVILISAAPAVHAVHPVSHVDAWLTVDGTECGGKLIAFLDDVIRFGNLPANAEGLIDRSIFAAAAEAHGHRLLQQIRIYDQLGRPLTAELIASPEADLLPERIDSELEGALRLSWQVRWTAQQPLTGMTFLPAIGHPDLVTPAELRLHIQPPGGGRRLDAVVFDAAPHSVLFSVPESDRPATATPVLSGDVNAPAVVVLRGAGEVVVETTLPLTLWLNRTAAESGGTVAGFSEELTAARLRELAIPAGTTLSETCRLQSESGESLSASAVHVRYFRTIDPGQLIDVTVDDPAFPAAVLSMTVHQRFQLPLSFGHPVLQWTSVIDTVDAIDVTRITGSGSESIRQPMRDGGLTIELPETPQSSASSVTAVSFDPSTVPWHMERHRPAAWTMWVVAGVVLGGGFIVRFTRQGRPVVIGVMLVLSSLLLGVSYSTIRVPDVAVAESITGRLMQSAVSAAAGSRSDRAADALLAVMEPELAEAVFLSVREDLSRTPDGESGFVLGMNCDELTVDSVSISGGDAASFRSDAVWVVSGRVFHWGHLHHQRRVYRGALTVASSGEHWRLTNVDVSESMSSAELSNAQPTDSGSSE